MTQQAQPEKEMMGFDFDEWFNRYAIYRETERRCMKESSDATKEYYEKKVKLMEVERDFAISVMEGERMMRKIDSKKKDEEIESLKKQCSGRRMFIKGKELQSELDEANDVLYWMHENLEVALDCSKTIDFFSTINNLFDELTKRLKELEGK